MHRRRRRHSRVRRQLRRGDAEQRLARRPRPRCPRRPRPRLLTVTASLHRTRLWATRTRQLGGCPRRNLIPPRPGLRLRRRTASRSSRRWPSERRRLRQPGPRFPRLVRRARRPRPRRTRCCRPRRCRRARRLRRPRHRRPRREPLCRHPLCRNPPRRHPSRRHRLRRHPLCRHRPRRQRPIVRPPRPPEPPRVPGSRPGQRAPRTRSPHRWRYSAGAQPLRWRALPGPRSQTHPRRSPPRSWPASDSVGQTARSISSATAG